MQLSWGIQWLFWLAALAAVWASWGSGYSGSTPGFPQWQIDCLKMLPQHLKDHWRHHVGGLAMAGVFVLVALGLHLELANQWAYLLGGAGLMSLLASLPLSAATRGLLLVVVAYGVFSGWTDLTTLSLPLLASFSGLLLGKLWQLDDWDDLLLPGAWLVGLYWLTTSTLDNLLLPKISLLTVMLSVSLLLRGVQAVPAMKQVPRVVQVVFLVITGGLGAWLGVQNLLLQPTLLPWAGLFAGGIGLGMVLFHLADEPTGAASAEALPMPLQAGVMAFIGIGLAALLASRLFDTLAYTILAIGILSHQRLGRFGAVSVCFLLGRVLLQVFLQQYNTNVTGINIMHPYASAALYMGFGLMLLLPHGLNASQMTQHGNLKPEASASIQFPALAILWMSLIALGSAGFANYFLHVEATASLLLAFLVAGLGVGLLGTFKASQARSLPLVLTLLSQTGVLAIPEVLSWGNAADKNEKMLVLAGAFVLMLLAGLLAQRLASRRQPVQVS